MVTKLYFFKTKKQLLKWCEERGYSKRACEKAWTGPGHYYARSRSHISKHTPHLDRRRGKKVGRGPWRHTHDVIKVVRRLKREVSKASKSQAKKVTKKLGAGKKVESKAVKAITAKALAKALKRARQTWARSPAVRSLAEDIWRWIPKRYKRGKDRVWTYIMALALAKAIHDRAKEKGIDPYQYDWKELVDWSLGYHYAKGLVREALGKTLEEIAKEDLERWKYISRMYEDSEWEKMVARELDDVARYELEHLDDIIGF
ncbi:putative Glutamyl-tRNAGlu reductase [Aeropyrum globular virus 1]|uniref:putative Glutamyl-tRNAGlu reductase n=1 Tax=Aeropyrum globular virus 1 TaxID=1932713 RepID=UPI000C7EB5D7|nr:putative Glutamyl-tRNAGlu reductase [Aeropyrum globular virus 1]BBC20956.1 putative Glutamyl-tRNAGlu reductase [Aeropyrum globular virus 1]